MPTVDFYSIKLTEKPKLSSSDYWNIYTKVKEVLETKYFQKHRILLPSEITYKTEIAYHFVAKNDMELSFFVSFIVSFGINIVFEVIEKGYIKDIFHLLKLCKTINKTVLNYCKYNLERSPLLPADCVMYFTSEFLRREYTRTEQIDFIAWFNKNSSYLFEDKMLICKDEIMALFQVYETEKFNQRKWKDVAD